VDVVESDIDFLTFSGHKLFGPSGVGILYGRETLLAEMPPFLGGGHMIDEVFHDHSTWAPLPAKFEAGTLPIAQAIGLGAAVDYVRAIGFDRIQAHEHDLLVYAHEQLEQVPGLHIYGPDVDHKGCIISFTIDGASAEDLAQLLDRKGVFVRHGHHCTMPLHRLIGVPATVRASLALYNSRDDVDRLVDALQFARQRLRLD
jgi:cysteine desulfurase/selenocysteine lyase